MDEKLRGKLESLIVASRKSPWKSGSYGHGQYALGYVHGEEKVAGGIEFILKQYDKENEVTYPEQV